MTTTRSRFLDLLTTDISKLFASEADGKTRMPLPKYKKRWLHRKSERRHPPYGSTKLDGQLLTGQNEDFTIAVWDLNESGACLRATTNPASHLNARITLRVRNEQRTETIEIEAVVRWIDEVAPNLFFAGVLFICDPAEIRASFLSSYL